MSGQIILASASPRRRELLEQIGVSYEVMPVDIDESPLNNETALDYVERIAAEKAHVCQFVNKPDRPVLAADTAVVLDDSIMGKPKDFEHARRMLLALSGRMHRVYSAIVLRMGNDCQQAVSITEVTFRSLSEDEIAAYWQTGEPADKAGAYAVQGMGSIFIESIKGSYSGVMGLPLFETAQLLQQQGIKVLK